MKIILDGRKDRRKTVYPFGEWGYKNTTVQLENLMQKIVETVATIKFKFH